MLVRTLLQPLVDESLKPFASILIGPRQVGKTVLLRMLEECLPGKTTFLDAENPVDGLVFSKGLKTLLAECGTKAQTLLIDEFHRIPDALGLFKQLRDGYPQIKVYASGSSSIEIHGHLKQSAVGRIRTTRIFPLSFPEWAAERSDLPVASLDPTTRLPPRAANHLAELLDEFVIWGGMPELTHADDENDKRKILREIVRLYLEKDIRSLLRPDEVIRFNEFLRLVGLSVGQFANRSHFGHRLEMNSRQTLRQLTVMEHTFVYRPVTTDYSNPTKRLIKAPKIFFYDNGVRNALVRDFRRRVDRPDGGALLENHVFGELEKHAGVDIDVLCHRTADGQEIDFVLERDRLKLLVEVKSTVARTKIPPAISELLARDDVLAGVVMADRVHETVGIHGKPVHFMPHYLAHRVPDLLREGSVSYHE